MMATVKPAYDVVNHGDSNHGVEVSVAAWVARTHDDPVAQFVACAMGEVKHFPALVWYENARPAASPEPALLDQRLSNDIVISRTGWGAEDNVLALRSGGPANHEHADRNSVIFKAYGERLLHDPFRAAYMVQSPRWILRLTEAHSAVLIDGKGHQYHDGSEGTNASWAFAKVTDHATGRGWMRVTSDATEAYQLVNDDVALVQRTLVYLKPDVVVLLDRVEMKTRPAPVQVRFQLYNEDGGGQQRIDGDEFTITRPGASLLGRIGSRAGLRLQAGRLPLEPKDGEQQFAEVASAESRTHAILTVCTAAPAGKKHGRLQLVQGAAGWEVRGEHNGLKVNLSLTPGSTGVPLIGGLENR